MESVRVGSGTGFDSDEELGGEMLSVGRMGILSASGVYGGGGVGAGVGSLNVESSDALDFAGGVTTTETTVFSLSSSLSLSSPLVVSPSTATCS